MTDAPPDRFAPWLDARRADEPLEAWVERTLAPRANRLAHTLDVAARARALAVVEGVDPELAERAGLLHDIARIAPLEAHAGLARAAGLALGEDEERHPWLIHQRLGAEIARVLGGEREPSVLGAIACHTTLRAEPAPIDVVVFVADKLGWRKRPRSEWQLAADAMLDAGAPALDVARELLRPWDVEDDADRDPPAILVSARRWFGVPERAVG